MENEFRQIVYRITNFTGPGSLSKLEDKLVGLPGVKFVDFEFPVAVLRIDVDESAFKDSAALESLTNLGFAIETRDDSTS
ncbi:MAG TPA: hypothetical protein PKH33_09185 [bacterium]|nr:hypothetical protein [bacterium]